MVEWNEPINIQIADSVRTRDMIDEVSCVTTK